MATSRFWVFGSRLALGGFIATGQLVEIGFPTLLGLNPLEKDKKK
jgi:hypothetical protein